MASPVYIMKTDDGTHAPETWAEMISTVLFPIGEDVGQQHLLAAKSVQLKIATSLALHAETILNREKQLLAADSDARFDAAHDGHEFVDAAIADIYSAVSGSMWDHMVHAREDALRHELAMHFGSMQSVERMFHSDHNPSDKGDAYKAKTQGIGI